MFWGFIDIPVGVSTMTIICPKECILPYQAIKANPKISAVFSNDSIQECLFSPIIHCNKVSMRTGVPFRQTSLAFFQARRGSDKLR